MELKRVKELYSECIETKQEYLYTAMKLSVEDINFLKEECVEYVKSCSRLYEHDYTVDIFDYLLDKIIFVNLLYTDKYPRIALLSSDLKAYHTEYISFSDAPNDFYKVLTHLASCYE